VVGGQDRVAVVLHDEHRVAEVAQLLQRAEQPLVVALVQADRRLVQDVEHADERLPICVASRIRCASPPDSVSALRPERQVLEADVDQEAQPLADLLQDGPGDLGGSDATRPAPKNASASATLSSHDVADGRPPR
jgi:hypothetical protein